MSLGGVEGVFAYCSDLFAKQRAYNYLGSAIREAQRHSY